MAKPGVHGRSDAATNNLPRVLRALRRAGQGNLPRAMQEKTADDTPAPGHRAGPPARGTQRLPVFRVKPSSPKCLVPPRRKASFHVKQRLPVSAGTGGPKHRRHSCAGQTKHQLSFIEAAPTFSRCPIASLGSREMTSGACRPDGTHCLLQVPA